MKSSLRKYVYAPAIIIVIGYAFVTLRGPQGVPAWMHRQQEIRELEKRNAELAREIEAKRERINRLRDNQSLQELEIRQRWKLVRPGEKVFILQDSGKKTRPQQAP